MNKFFAFALATLTPILASAQEESMERLRIENTTDYTKPVISKFHKVGLRSTAPIPCTGSPKIPVVLVQFNNKKFTVEDTEEKVKENYHKFCNGSGILGKRYQVQNGIWGSISDYFIEQSDSIFQPEFTVIGPVTLSENYEYYGKDSNNSKDVNIDKFYSEACKLAIENNNIDWTQFDNNYDGKVDFIFFIYAGRGQNNTVENNSNLIWPKENASGMAINVDDKKIWFAAYGCCNELINNKQDGIGTMCHELSHGLGLPDLYDVKGKSYGMDYLDLMDAGDYQIQGNQPCCYSAYERDFMGWRKLEVLPNDEKLNLKLLPIETGGIGYVIKNPSKGDGTEYFILENRQNLNFDTYLGCQSAAVFRDYGPCHGLMITHVDYFESKWISNNVNADSEHQRFTLVPADKALVSSSIAGYTYSYFRSLRGDLYPGGEEVTEMSDYSVFNGTFYDRITDIKEHEDGTITLKINGGIDEPEPPVNPGDEDEPDAITSLSSTNSVAYKIYNVQGQHIQSLQKGTNIIKYSTGDIKKIIVR